MLNGRLYLQSWLIAVVALLVAFLTLQPRDAIVEPEQAASFDAAGAVRQAAELATAAPLREPGSAAAATWVEKQFRALPGGERVALQKARAQVDGADVTLTNVFFTLPARAQTTSQRNILVVAPRDAPRGAVQGADSTAILVELARRASQGRYRHPIIFLSADGGSLGNAGTRWYLGNVQPARIAGMIVIDAPAGGTGREIAIWAGGASRQAQGMRQLAERAVRDAGFVPSPAPSFGEQLLRFAIPETRGEQRAGIDAGVPAVTLAGRRESVLPFGSAELTTERMQAAGTAAMGLIGLVDVRERANAPDASLAYAGRTLRPSVARLSLLLLLLPLVVMALDAAARVRRARVRVSRGLSAVGWRIAVPMAVVAAGHLLALWGFLHPPVIGRPPVPSELRFTGETTVVAIVLVAIGVATWMIVRPRVRALGVQPPAEAAGALVVLALAGLLAWWIAPFTLVLILPAAHAVLAATVAPRRWQVGVLAALALLAPLAAVLMVARDIDRGPVFSLWYLFETSVSGGRGLAGPLLAVVVATCVVSLCTLIAFRMRKGIVSTGGKGPAHSAENLSSDKSPEEVDDDGRAGRATRRGPVPRRDP
jgi:hypothetical protein